MPINVTVRMQDIWQYVGLRAQSQTFRFNDPEWRIGEHAGPHVGVYFFWPKTSGFVQLRGSFSHGGKTGQFQHGSQGLLGMYRQLGVDCHFDEAFLQQHHFAAAVLPTTADVNLEFRVDTDDPRFIQAVKQKQLDRAGISVFIKTWVELPENQEEGEIRVDLEPAEPPPDDLGSLALDLGNTSSTLAYLEAGKRYAREVQFLDADATPGKFAGKPVDSAVRIDRVNRASLEKFRDHPACFSWVIGARVQPKTIGAGGGGDGIELGAKRLLASREFHQALDYRVLPEMETEPGVENGEMPREAVPLPRRLPAELLLCRMLQRFREATYHQPVALAITYPTTYSSRELRQLREVATRAICRLRVNLQTPPNLEKAEGSIYVVVDEASAAAFSTIFRQILEAPGDLMRLRYLYPNGLNLLLYDCGGGTTDLALVNARVDPKAPDNLDVRVKARGGLRDFGGDDITIAVWRILRARLALAVAKVRNDLDQPAFPESQLEQLSGFLAEHAEFFNRRVPTKYNPKVMNAEDRRNRDHTHLLWTWAVELKHKLQQAPATAPEPARDRGRGVNDELPADRVRLFPTQYGFGDVLSMFLLQGLAEQQRKGLRAALGEITVRRGEVDALIRPAIERTISAANHMIREKLFNKADGGPPEEVDWVVVVGNGSRYPLIRELLRQKVNVLFYDEREKYDEDSLKTAVGQGAVLALRARTLFGQQATIHFDWDLSKRLPHDVGFVDKLGGPPRLLYSEHQLFAELGRETLEVTRKDDAVRQEWVYLTRRWPGEEEHSPFLGFHFPQGVQGKVTIEYDKDKEEFVAYDQMHTMGIPYDLGTETIYTHPVQRGDLEPVRRTAAHAQ